MVALSIVCCLVQLLSDLGLTPSTALRISFFQAFLKVRKLGFQFLVIRMVRVGEELREVISVQVLILEACRTEDRLLIGEVVGERVYPYGSGKALLRCCLFYWDICYLSILDSC